MPEKPKHTLPLSSAERKNVPIYSGVIRYFPAALAGVARVSLAGNNKHNGVGTPMRHSRGKSMDHADCEIRHMIDMADNDGYEYVLDAEGQIVRDAEGVPAKGIPQVYYKAWRALAEAQEWAEQNEDAPFAPAASFGEHAAPMTKTEVEAVKRGEDPFPSPRPFATPGSRSRG